MRRARHASMRRRFILKGETSPWSMHSEVLGCARLGRASDGFIPPSDSRSVFPTGSCRCRWYGS